MNDNFVSQLTDNCPQIIYIHSIIDNRRQNGIYIYISSGTFRGYILDIVSLASY